MVVNGCKTRLDSTRLHSTRLHSTPLDSTRLHSTPLASPVAELRKLDDDDDDDGNFFLTIFDIHRAIPKPCVT
eukprot:jgi/Psemu1/22540/gm1.22540_g